MIKFHCSQCQQKIGVKDEAAGKKVKCPGCGTITVVPQEKSANPMDDIIAERLKEVNTPQIPSPTRTENLKVSEPTKDCSFCGETILATAKKCKHCGEFLNDSSSNQTSNANQIIQESQGVLRFRGSYADALTLLESTMIQCGGKIKDKDLNSGRLEGAWRHGVNMFGLRVKANFVDLGDGSIRISITGGFKDALDTFGSGKKKAKEIAQAFMANATRGFTTSSGSFLPPRGHIDDFPHRGKSKTTAGIFGILLGGLGIHKFYLGSWGWGILYIFFIWTYIPAVVGFIEGIIYLAMSQKNFDRKYNLEETSAFTW